jgi:hypothetical protein
MFNEICEKIAKEKELHLIHVQEYDDSTSNIKRKEYMVYFFKKINDVAYPASFKLQTTFSEYSSKKEVWIETNVPFPKKELLEATYAFISSFEPFFEDYFTKVDVNRVKKIANGEVYKGENINYRVRDQSADLVAQINEPCDEEVLDKLYKQLAQKQVTYDEDREPRKEDYYWLFYGVKGRQLAQKLKENLLAEVEEIDENMIAVKPLFPFCLEGEEKHLSAYYLRHYNKSMFEKANMLTYSINESTLRKYHR